MYRFSQVSLQITQLKVQLSLSLSYVNFDEKQQTFLRAMPVLSLIGSLVPFFLSLFRFLLPVLIVSTVKS